MALENSKTSNKPKFVRRILKNGMTVVHEPRNLPIISLAITNRFGSLYEPSNIKGIAHFIEHLLFTGTKNRSSKEISREIDKKGGILNAFTHNEITSYWVKIPSEHLQIALEIISDMLNNSLINKEKFEKEKSVILEEIKMYHDDPKSHVVSEKIFENLYKAPFGKNYIIGSKETISSLTRDFVFEYYKKAYNPKNFIVTLVGSCDLDSVCNFLESNFKPLDIPDLTPQKIEKQSLSSKEERPGIDQAHLVFGFHAPLPGTKEYRAIQVLNSYLTVGMSSKLMTEIREKRGLAYAVHGSVEAEKSYSTYTIYVGTTSEAIPEVKSIILKELESVSDLSQEDLNDAKEQLIGLRKVTSEESINVLTSLIYSELRNSVSDYYNLEEEINSVSLEDVKSIASKLLKEYSIAEIIPKKSP